jgi:hypothetical protein
MDCSALIVWCQRTWVSVFSDEVRIFVYFWQYGLRADQWCVCTGHVGSHLESSEASKRLSEHLPWTVQSYNLWGFGQRVNDLGLGKLILRGIHAAVVNCPRLTIGMLVGKYGGLPTSLISRYRKDKRQGRCNGSAGTVFLATPLSKAASVHIWNTPQDCRLLYMRLWMWGLSGGGEWWGSDPILWMLFRLLKF